MYGTHGNQNNAKTEEDDDDGTATKSTIKRLLRPALIYKPAFSYHIFRVAWLL